jgi:hypothetical protein
MKLLTEETVVVCKHELGIAINRPTQNIVTIEKQRVLVDNNPEATIITRCPNVGATIKPCTLTLKVLQGYSDWIRIDSKAVCLDTVTGLTDGTPPGTVEYLVRDPGQQFVSQIS